MSLEDVTAQIKQKMAGAAGLRARAKFDFGEEGRVFVDTKQTPPVISHDDEPADVTLQCSLETFSRILAGTQDPNVAFMTGKLKIKGSMALAMRLNAVLED